MNIVIPMDEDQLSTHFTKADSFLFVNEQGEMLSQHANPALNANCSGKQNLLDLLQQNNADRIVVRNIGEQMLGKLLKLGVTVLQSPGGRKTVKDIANCAASFIQLTQASQGRPSPNHAAKSHQGKNDCHHNDKDGASSQRCCQKEGHHQGKGHHHGEAHGHHKGHGGRGRCCQS